MKTKQLLAKTLGAAFFAGTMLLSSSVFAQVKVGTNPTTIGANSNLEVEATNGNKTVIQKDNGNVGIGTSAPGNKLEIDQGTAGNSGLRFTRVNNSTAPTTTNIAPLGVNNNGDVVVISNSPSTVFRGNVSVGDVNTINNNPSLPVTGYISSASSSSGDGGVDNGYFTVVVLTFPSLGTIDYSVSADLEATAPNQGGFSVGTLAPPVITNKTATGFRVYLRELQQIGQDLRLNIIIAK